MWPCPYCHELHPVASRVDHLTIRHNRFPCSNCDHISASADGLTKHDGEMHRYTVKDGGPFDGAGSVGPVMEVSGFIMEVLLTLRDIKEQQNVQFGKLSEQIGTLREEMEEVKQSVGQQMGDVEEENGTEGDAEPEKGPVELVGEMIYTEPWNPQDFFPIKSVDQLQQLEEISRFAEEHAHFKDLKMSLESQNPDGWNPNGLVEFGKTFDRTFALKLFVTPEETSQQCISLGDYKAFVEVLRDSWKAAGPKRINRRLRHYLKLNRENITTSNADVDDVPQVNSTSDEVDRNVNGKRVNSPVATTPDQSTDGDFVVIKRRRGATMRLVNFRQEQQQQLQNRELPGRGSCM